MTIPQTWFCRDCFNKPLAQHSRMVYFFIYVVADLPSSYTELTSRQRLMLKIT